MAWPGWSYKPWSNINWFHLGYSEKTGLIQQGRQFQQQHGHVSSSSTRLSNLTRVTQRELCKVTGAEHCSVVPLLWWHPRQWFPFSQGCLAAVLGFPVRHKAFHVMGFLWNPGGKGVTSASSRGAWIHLQKSSQCLYSSYLPPFLSIWSAGEDLTSVLSVLLLDCPAWLILPFQAGFSLILPMLEDAWLD